MRHVVERIHDEVLRACNQRAAIGSQVFVVVHHLNFMRLHELHVLGNQNKFQFIHVHVRMLRTLCFHDGNERPTRAIPDCVIKCKQLHCFGEIMRHGSGQWFRGKRHANTARNGMTRFRGQARRRRRGPPFCNIIAGRNLTRIQLGIRGFKRVVSRKPIHDSRRNGVQMVEIGFQLGMQQNEFILSLVVVDGHQRRQRRRLRQNEPPNSRVSQQFVGQFPVIKCAIVQLAINQIFLRQNDFAFGRFRIDDAHARVWAVFDAILGRNARHEFGGIGFEHMT